ncbi:Protein of unknown function (DUF3037) [Pontibacter ummariensis]|uniref:DUF3037 domain-containing protein n=1 Tax=Pontibacter ummariensis TaxID=1610492 RepID=A0A239D4C6_9BACT|nr:DUF3037 domain-containing protein [Pontibacter ummariensis]PRY14249.1 Protein of unknown function (DUF3037) [Pontibacter ummariensis]SNS27356.1 Protein of unknown function [Pontibacter ummariensis]
MQEKHLFEYAVIRVVPCVEREEFINVGVIVYCASKGFLKTKCELNGDRLCSFSDKVDLEELEERLRAFERICAGRKEGGTIGSLPIASRFRWLTATRSTVVQTSPVHPGLCTDPQETLEKLYKQLVQ